MRQKLKEKIAESLTSVLPITPVSYTHLDVYKRQEQTVSRAEAVKMINRALGRADAMGTQSPFPDVPLSHWACGAIRAATSPS